MITILNEYGRPVDVVDINGTLVVRKTFQKRKDNIIKPPKEELNKKEILVVSDTLVMKHIIVVLLTFIILVIYQMVIILELDLTIFMKYFYMVQLDK